MNQHWQSVQALPLRDWYKSRIGFGHDTPAQEVREPYQMYIWSKDLPTKKNVWLYVYEFYQSLEWPIETHSAVVS